MGITDYFGHKISGLAAKNRDNILSLSSGLLIALLFLVLLPSLPLGEGSEVIFLDILIGFLCMHFIEKFIYRHVTNKRKLLQDLKMAHIVGFGLDNFLVGFIIATIAETDLIIALELSIPFFLQMLTSSISLDSMDVQLNDKFSKILLSVLPVLGALVGILLDLEHFLTQNVLALILGILFYMIIRDVIPSGKRGNPILFFIGNAISIMLWLILITY
jgi:zinc transporter ZupT